VSVNAQPPEREESVVDWFEMHVLPQSGSGGRATGFKLNARGESAFFLGNDRGVIRLTSMKPKWNGRS